MTLRRTVTGTIGALALLAATTSASLAVPTGPNASTDVDIKVTSTGVLSVAVTETEPFDDMSYSFSDEHSQGQLTVTVTDLRGTAAGWNFNLRSSGDFEGENTTDSIPVGGLGLGFLQVTRVAGNTNFLGVTGHSIQHVSTTGQKVASAPVGEGNGEYAILFGGDLLVPGDTLVDTYETTLTVEVPSAP